MEALYRYANGALLGVAALFTPIKSVILCALLFIFIDFVTGVLASRCEAKHRGERWFFSSHEAWRTIRKAGFVILTIAMSWLVESCVLDFLTLNVTRLITGVICGVELWSFLENASVLSDAKVFEWLRQYVKRKVEKEIGEYDKDQ
ncbi:MAG: phage holin family protein [Alistipes sp.]|nr:phage holin family protein [Alistipes sp.]